MVARVKRWLESAVIPYKDVKVSRGFATFALGCSNNQTERDAALGLMNASINVKGGNVLDNWEVRENRSRRPNNRPGQTPVETLIHQARNKVREAQCGKLANVRINMNWFDRSLYVTDMTINQNTLLRKVATITKIWEWASQAAIMLCTDPVMMLVEERPVRQHRERRDIPAEE